MVIRSKGRTKRREQRVNQNRTVCCPVSNDERHIPLIMKVMTVK